MVLDCPQSVPRAERHRDKRTQGIRLRSASARRTY